MIAVGAAPFGVVTTADNRWSFVGTGGGIMVLSGDGLALRAVRTIATPGAEPLGETLTHDGRYLLAADGGGGAVVVDLARAESGAAGAVLGTLSGLRADGAIEVVVSPDDRYAFVSIEYASEIAVFDLGAALADGLRSSHYVGAIPLGEAVVGMAVSPDGRWLYATSEVGAHPAAEHGDGTLSVIDLARAETRPAGSMVSTVAARCSPVRVAVSSDGKVVWVTARESDELLAFSAARLRSDPAHSQLASVRVGEAPVGLALVDGDRRIVVADSNRFDAAGARSGLTVVNAVAALAGRPAVLGVIPAGLFPRDMALEPGGRTLLVSNFASAQEEAVDVASLP
jgi:DNA-binding beta-propeller fold protein YncE